MKVDAYTHFACPAFIDHLEEASGHPMVFRGLFNAIPELCDVEARIRFMDLQGIDMHCLVPLPWLECEPELHADVDKAVQACRLANDEMAKVVALYPERFVGVALIPTTTEQARAITACLKHCIGHLAMVEEATRALVDLGLEGVAVFVGPTAKPPDDPSFEGLYRVCHERGAPIWLHPNRPQVYADYDAYKAKGSQYQIWNTLGWIYDTSVAMVHIALAGVFQRYPGIKFVSHHHGGMIPFFTERFHTQRQNFNEGDEDNLLEDLMLFYCDTATFGESPQNIQQAIDFFGPERVLFGTDTPMDMGEAGYFTRNTKNSIEALRISGEEKEGIYHRNVTRMLWGDSPPSARLARQKTSTPASPAAAL
ncbi:unnamed protein product [Discosporangium mesarthrocarpum]